MASAASSTFRFLDLPAEIRNLIYSLLFERHGPCYAAIEDEGDPRPPHTTLLRRGDWIVIPMNDSSKSTTDLQFDD